MSELVGKRPVLREAVGAVPGQGLLAFCEEVVCEVVEGQGLLALCEEVACEALEAIQCECEEPVVRLDLLRHVCHLGLRHVCHLGLCHVCLGLTNVLRLFPLLFPLRQFPQLPRRLHRSRLFPRFRLFRLPQLHILSRNPFQEHPPLP